MKNTKVQTLAASTTIDIIHCVDYLCYYTHHHHVKYGRFHSATEQLIWKKFRMKVADKHKKHGAIQYWEPKRIGKQSLVQRLFYSVNENINQNYVWLREFQYGDWWKRLKTAFSLKRNGFATIHTYSIVYRTFSIAVLLHM